MTQTAASCTTPADHDVLVPVPDTTLFRQVLGHFASGVVVVTAMTPAGPVGLTCQSFSAVSLDPPLVLFCARRESWSWTRIRAADHFCINILHGDQQDLCLRFATPATDRFADLDWTTSQSGAPVLPGVLGWVDCDVANVHAGGDHDIAVGRVLSLGVATGDDEPLLYYRGDFGRFVSRCGSTPT